MDISKILKVEIIFGNKFYYYNYKENIQFC